ncbi:MAG: hypothetical protein ACNS62_02170 [Candidatus Cyclobacteriaceae bacterium M3_2C_046]
MNGILHQHKLISDQPFVHWFNWAFSYFVLVALMGAFLRFLLVHPATGINYRFILHTHSHIAFLGWVFNFFYAAIIKSYLSPQHQQKPVYRTIFFLLQLAVLGMLFTFPLQGYGRESIIFSTLHVLLSFWLVFRLFRDLPDPSSSPVGVLFIKAALVFMVISSMGPFALGPLMVLDLSHSPWYNLSIYFYLHFQYNGWFTFALLGLLFWQFHQMGLTVDNRKSRTFFWLMAISCLPAYLLSAFWAKPPAVLYYVGYLAAFLQLVALGYFFKILINLKNLLKNNLSRTCLLLLIMSLLSFFLKILFQFITIFDPVMDLAYSVRPFTIAYLHLVFIGFVSLYMLQYLIFTWFHPNPSGVRKIGLLTFLVGFVLSQLATVIPPWLLMFRGISLPYSNQVLFFVSCLMPLGLLLFKPPKLRTRA